MFGIKQWVYNFLIPLVFLAHQKACSTAEDYSVEITFEPPEDIITQHSQSFTTKSTFNGDSDDNENFTGMQSKSIEVDVQKFSSGTIYPDIAPLNGHNQLPQNQQLYEQNPEQEQQEQQQRTDPIREQNVARENAPNGDPTGYLTMVASGPNDSKEEWVTNHKKLARSTFEKHKAHHRNYRRYGGGHRNHRKSSAKHKKYEHLKNSNARKRLTMQNLFNQQDQQQQQQQQQQYRQQPYYYQQGQVNYYSGFDGDDDSVADESIYLSPPSLSRMLQKPSFSSMTNKIRKHHRYHPHHRGGHHLNTMDEYKENTKWPHLSRVQYQLYEDEKNDDEEEEDLPPYIKKYNRRNKQLLDLLEGTMPPPTMPPSLLSLSPSSSSSQSSQSQLQFNNKADASSSAVNRKRERSQRRRYHNHKNPKWIMEDLFEEQRANPNNPNTDEDQYVNDSASIGSAAGIVDIERDSTSTLFKAATVSEGRPGSSSSALSTSIVSKSEEDELKLIQENELPEDDISISIEDENEEINDNNGDRNGNSQSNKSDKRPQNHSELQQYNIKNREQSLSGSGTVSGAATSTLISNHRISSSINNNNSGSNSNSSNSNISSDLKYSPKTNKFIYHRIDAPGIVGAGTGGSKKQRLPFVAITDRRLETSKMRSKDFEQNHQPMP